MRVITDKAQIESILTGFVRQPKQQAMEFILEIHVAPGADWNGWTVTQGGLIVEGARPFGLATFCQTGEKVFSLTNSDSGYTRSIGAVKLSEVQSISLLH